ncbi:RecT family recombinase [Cytobacillus sp. IB215665]|uniref:RecT family recombinase n=1 Tax=Cytobacillus sp. IB215665 TaxID=3097357 RepID=UPI002A0EE363|nr:RecT family recombinase [Cytobacillus sp. IB215665]MDX8367677.1 RecT family recombinase [Cytobacillus sp. IB215665]
MKKVMEFTQEQKVLIWNVKVQPKNGTPDDAKIFVEICETYGLNPLLGDIVFQRYESKMGPVVNYITTRDGYLKAAMRDSEYVRVISAVVKEGDHFKFDVVDGSVKHEFGTKRGNILGAWAIAEHKTRGRLSVFVDFDEYFRANAKSQNGRSPIWDSMPSAMIQKVAETFVLRRQFPLTGITTEEEMGTNEFIEDVAETPVQPQSQPQSKVVQKQNKDVINISTKQDTKEKTNSKAKNKPKNEEEPKEETKTKTNPPKTESKEVNTESTKPELQVEQEPAKTQEDATEAQETQKPEPAPPTPKNDDPFANKQESTPTPKNDDPFADKQDDVSSKKTSAEGSNLYRLQRVEIGVTPATNVPYAKLFLSGENGQVLVLARGQEKVDLADQVVEGQLLKVDYVSENSYNFLQSIEVA